MNNYKKSSKFKESLEIQVRGLEESTSVLVVTPGTQIRIILPNALESLKKDGQILWVGCGAATDKAVACAEATKSRFRGLHQETQITTKRVEEFWEPTIEGMNILQVERNIPAIAILLSLTKLRKNENSSTENVKYGKRVFCDWFDS